MADFNGMGIRATSAQHRGKRDIHTMYLYAHSDLHHHMYQQRMRHCMATTVSMRGHDRAQLALTVYNTGASYTSAIYNSALECFGGNSRHNGKYRLVRTWHMARKCHTCLCIYDNRIQYHVNHTAATYTLDQ